MDIMPNYIKCNLVNKIWYQRHLLAYILLPAAFVYFLIIKIRSWLYKLGLKKITKFKVPVIVVGNISVGGTGKTPLVIWLTEFLQQQGFKPGIVSRGYGGQGIAYPHIVNSSDKAEQVGDEPLLIFRRTACPVVISPKRVDAVKKLLVTTNCDVVISDDGLQHYALGRDIEIVVVDVKRKFGNGFLLPAGPLRETKAKLKKVDITVENGGNMQLNAAKCYNLAKFSKVKSLKRFAKHQVHAVAAIGNPDRFFYTLREFNIEVIEHPFPDHHKFTLEDLSFNDDLPVLMTEKDAVKCEQFAKDNFWVVPVAAQLSEQLQDQIDNLFILIKART